MERTPEQLNVRLTDEERDRFDALAQHYGLSPTNVVRMLVKREGDAVLTSKRGRKT